MQVNMLAGFKKEQMKVQVNSQRIVTIQGQRPLDETKWSRFSKQIKLPDDCIEDRIRAKYAGGILTVTMTKKTTTKRSSSASSCQVQERSPPISNSNRSCTRTRDVEAKKCNQVNKDDSSFKQNIIDDGGNDDDDDDKKKKKRILATLMLKFAAVVVVVVVSGAYVNCVWKLQSCAKG